MERGLEPVEGYSTIAFDMASENREAEYRYRTIRTMGSYVKYLQFSMVGSECMSIVLLANLLESLREYSSGYRQYLPVQHLGACGLNTAGDEKPAKPQAVASIRLSDIFASSDNVVIGNTAGIWAQADFQNILDWNQNR